MNYLTEGSDVPMGVEKREAPRYRAVCHWCSWHGKEHLDDRDAEDELLDHSEDEIHQKIVIRKLVQEHQGLEYDPYTRRLR